ncbi:FKBP-type peptidyl-prolyl cis-trans isomerase [uncultured archaeon]|nr:FKBP-type peptidyl-prolyl cis-trans isomerase [uncultured archaeon]
MGFIRWRPLLLPYKMKNSHVILIAAAVVLAVIIYAATPRQTGESTPVNVFTTTTAPPAPDDGKTKKGDSVSIDFIGYFINGSIADTTIESVARQNGIYDSGRTYKPLAFIVGERYVIDGLDEAVVGMQVGQDKNVTVPPEKAYGTVSKSKVEAVLLSQPSPRFQNTTAAAYESVTSRAPAVGDATDGPDGWPMTVVAVSNGTVTLRHDPGANATISTPFGAANVTADNMYVYVNLPVLPVGSPVTTSSGDGRVTAVNRTHMIVDYNSPYAGITFMFNVKLVSRTA